MQRYGIRGSVDGAMKLVLSASNFIEGLTTAIRGIFGRAATMLSPRAMMRSIALAFLTCWWTDAFQVELRASRSVDTLLGAVKSAARQSRIGKLVEWSTSAEIQTGPMELKADPSSGLGWWVKQNAPAGSVLLSVPASVALTVESPGDGPDLAATRQLLDRRVLDELPWYVQMSLYLHQIDRKDSAKNNLNMRDWLDSLPRSFDTPIHWSSLDELQYPYMNDAVERQSKTWRSYHQQASSVGWSWDEFLWGCECARSRAFSGAYTGSAFNPLIYAFTLLLVTVYVGLHLGTLEQAANGAGVVFSVSILKDFVLPKLLKKKRYVICPMVDMANHQSVGAKGEVSFEYFGNAYSLAVAKGETVNAGEEVFISYGARSNDQLLQYYGFVESDNPNDVYVMPPLREWDIDALEQACGRTFAGGRLEKLDRAGLLGTAAVGDDEEAANTGGGVVLTRLSGMDPAILQALRALVSTEAEWRAAGEAIGNFVEELSGGAENERCARLAARKAIELELESKPTTLEEDRELLKRMASIKSMDSSREEELAVLFRIEKKKLLLETMNKL